ncbi:uncharacterized protein LOC108864425 [Galendromus occidentalis]|uniref:Uncharacterized protein LOC108864425 n=1 Tax=Galendromus occidentalis TaxID=34638 RepID=A0AAJ7L626_9ACAR|nr:uncharacterized protein LOC108864425 [Galendromus occidentalis]
MSVVSNGLKHVNSRAVAGQMPCTDLLRQQVRRSRSRAGVLAAPTNPTSREDFKLPERLKVTGKEESFVFYDSGEGDPDRILVFATPGNLNLLRNMMSASATYRRLLESIVGALNGSSPRLIHIDFEVAMIKELERAFPTTRILGCLFHFYQCQWRKIQSNPDLRRQYGEDPDFALQVRMFSALSFVPTRDLLPVFDSLLRSDFVKDNNYMLTPFINYFESTWVGRERSKPRMKHEWWNVHSSVLEGIARTNNAVEAWNSAFSKRVGSSNPNLFRFVEILITEQAKTDFMVNNCLAQGSNTLPKKRYRDRKKRLENLVSSYDQRGTLDFLEAIAHNISF